MGKWSWFRQASWRERHQLAWALVLLPATRLGLLLLGFTRTRDLLAAWSRRRARPVDEAGAAATAATLARLVAAAARHGLCRANCLPQALVLWTLLRAHGIASELRVGVRKAGRLLEAHAWVERGGRPLNDTADVHARFPPFAAGLAAPGTSRP